MKRESIIQGLSLCAVLIVVILTPGCATSLKMYKGEELPIQEIAVIKESFSPYNAQIFQIDKEVLESHMPGFSKVEVMPGFHKVIVRIRMVKGDFWDRFWGSPLFTKYVTYDYILMVTAEAGHQYKIKAQDLWEGSCPSIALVDIQSGAVIANSRDCR